MFRACTIALFGIFDQIPFVPNRRYANKKCSMIKRNVKDSVFLSFFGERDNVLDLYKELHPEDTQATLDDVSIRTINVCWSRYTRTIWVFR